MTSKPLIFINLFILIASLSCQNESLKGDKTKNSNDYILKEVSLLKETKLEEKRIDSIRNTTGIPVQMTIDIVDSSFYKEDSLNTALAFINQSIGFEKKLFTLLNSIKAKKR